MSRQDIVTINTDISLDTVSDIITPEYYISHFPEFICRYIAHGNPTRDTVKDYVFHISFFLKWCHTHKCSNPLILQDLHIRYYREFLLQQKYKETTIKSRLIGVKVFYGVAVKLGLIQNNPSEDITIQVPRVSDSQFTYFTPEQLGELVAFFDQEKDEFIRLRGKLMVYLMGAEGLRNVEVYRLNDEDIRENMNVILVRGKGTNGRIEPIYPSAATMELLAEYRRVRPVVPAKDAEGLTPTIISTSRANMGQRLSRRSIEKEITRALRACGYKEAGICCHALRHSCGTNLYAKDHNLREVQETLRHRSPETTARYTHVHDRATKRITTGLIK